MIPLLLRQDVLARLAGEKATQGALHLAGKRIAPWLLKKFPGLTQGGGRLGYGVNSLPYLLNRYAKSATKRDGMSGAIEDVFKGILGRHEMETTVGELGLSNLDKPATWDKLSRRSLIEIIPGLLSRIEHNTARVLYPAAERQVFSHDTREFMSLKDASATAVRQMFSPSKRASIKQNVNQFIDELVGKQPISEATRKALMRQLLLDSGNGEPFNPERYTSADSSTPELNAQAKVELGEIFRQEGVLKDGKRDQTWMAERGESFYKMDFGAQLPTSAASVYRSAGMRELLKDQDLIRQDKNKDKLNLGRLFDLIDDSNYNDIEVKERTAAERLRDAAGSKLSRFGKEVTDLYVQGGSKAVLEAGKLKVGAYRDAVSGRVITKWSDIQGPIRDLTTNEIVVDLTQLTAGLYDARGEKVKFSLRSLSTGAFNWASEQSEAIKQNLAPKARELTDIVNAKGEASVPGVFAAGDCRDDAIRQAVIAAGEGAAAAIGVRHYLDK
jgi:hypothetical protein